MWPGSVFEVGDRARPVNAAARLVTGTRRCDHITPVLRLPVYASASISRLPHLFIAASHLAVDCRLVADARQRRLCSKQSRTCVIIRTHKTFGDRAFIAAGPGLWNSLPPHLRDADLPYRPVQSVPAVTKDIFVWIVGSRLF